MADTEIRRQGSGLAPGHIKARETHVHRSVERRQALIEDVEFLLSVGEHRDLIVERLGYRSFKAIERQLHRLGRHDLARMVAAADRLERIYERGDARGKP